MLKLNKFNSFKIDALMVCLKFQMMQSSYIETKLQLRFKSQTNKLAQREFQRARWRH